MATSVEQQSKEAENLEYFKVIQHKVVEVPGKEESEMRDIHVLHAVRPTVHGNDQRIRIEVPAEGKEEIVNSIKDLKENDYISAMAYRYKVTIDQKDKDPVSYDILRPARPLFQHKEKDMSVTGWLNMDPKTQKLANDKEAKSLFISTYSKSEYEGGKPKRVSFSVNLPEDANIDELKKGDKVSFKAEMSSYYSKDKKTNVPLLVATGPVTKALEQSQEQSAEKGAKEKNVAAKENTAVEKATNGNQPKQSTSKKAKKKSELSK